MAELTYKEQLQADYEWIKSETRAGNLPIKQRLKAIEEASERYVVARAEDYDKRVTKAVAEDKKPGIVPIPYKDDRLLDYMASLCMDEYLRWSHPDKMSIVDDPVLSDWQQVNRWRSQPLNEDLQYGDRRGNGRRKSHFVDKDGYVGVSNHKMPVLGDPELDAIIEGVDIKNVLAEADLTSRQREIIDLIFFENMTQEAAATKMGIRRQVAVRHLKASLAKMRLFMTKG